MRANDKAQADLKKALTIYNYYLETKPREFDSLQIPKEKILTNDLVAVSYLGIVLKRPSDARSRKYKVWGEFYQKVFSGNIVEPYLLATLLYKKAFSYLNEKFSGEEDNIKRFIGKNASFHIARITAFLWMNGDNWLNDKLLKAKLSELTKNDTVLDDFVKRSFQFILKIVKSNAIFMDDLNSALKSSEMDAEINKRLYKTIKKVKVKSKV